MSQENGTILNLTISKMVWPNLKPFDTEIEHSYRIYTNLILSFHHNQGLRYWISKSRHDFWITFIFAILQLNSRLIIPMISRIKRSFWHRCVFVECASFLRRYYNFKITTRIPRMELMPTASRYLLELESFKKLSLKFCISRYLFFKKLKHLQILCDFQKYLWNFSSSNIKKVRKRRFLNTAENGDERWQAK